MNEELCYDKESLFGLIEGFCDINDISNKEEERIKDQLEKMVNE